MTLNHGLYRNDLFIVFRIHYVHMNTSILSNSVIVTMKGSDQQILRILNAIIIFCVKMQFISNYFLVV